MAEQVGRTFLPARCLSVGLAGLAALSALSAGCGRKGGLVLPPPAPIAAVDGGAELAAAWLVAWTGQPDRLGEAGVRDMFILGRPALPGGRVSCRAVLLAEGDRPVRADGPMRMVLVAEPNTPDQRPVAAWAIDADQVGRRFRYGVMPGYLLTLEWDDQTAAPSYMLVVRWGSPDGKARLIRKINF